MCNTYMAETNKVAMGILVGVLVAGGGLSGCTAPSAKKTNAVAKTKPVVERQVVIVNKGSAQKNNKRSVAKNSSGGKDKHHLEYEKKRLWYNQKWAARQEAEQRQQRQKYHDQYQARKRQQANQQQANQQQANQQQARVPHYGHQQNKRQQARVPHYGHTQVSYASARQQNHPQNRNLVRGPRYTSHQRPGNNHTNFNMAEHLSRAAIGRTSQRIRYDGRYIPISYPMGDVPPNMGVCTDVVVRSYRRLGIDLQRLVHEDMSRAFYAYPNLPKWGLSAPDPNIDHRRVHNLRVFFARHGQRLPISRNPQNYRPGDLVTWSLGGDQGHIGIVVNRRSPADPNRYMIVHNISSGTKMEDVLFNWPITGHFRYFPNRQPWLASAK